jgi:hypothetical protein
MTFSINTRVEALISNDDDDDDDGDGDHCGRHYK